MKSSGTAEKRIEGIFELHRSIISIFFKDFEEIFKLPEGLNFTHMRAALSLRFHGRMTMSELSRMLVIEKGSFTPVAALLIKKGYIRKEQSAQDKRVYHLVLTDEGIKLTTLFRNEHWKFMSEVLSQLPDDEQNDYFELVGRLNAYHHKIRKDQGP